MQVQFFRPTSVCIPANAAPMAGTASINMAQQRDRALLKKLVDRTGLSLSEIARKADISPSTLTRPQSSTVNHRLSVNTIERLAAAFPDAFSSADGEPPATVNSYVSVEMLPSFAGMGGGGSGDGDHLLAMLPRDLVVDQLHASPTDLILIDVRGDSMEPDFHHGDQILCDKRDRDPRQPGAFALWDGDAYVVKLVERVPRQPGRYRIFSANDRYSAYEVDESEIAILGRPVWFARRI